MWAKEKRNRVRIQWSAQIFRESSEKLDNRERGFYHLERFLITDEEKQKEEYYKQIISSPAKTKLILLQINLQNYVASMVSNTGIEQIRAIFQAYKEAKTDLIVRFLYDWDGRALFTEPADIDTILVHMEQMREIMRDFEESIYIVQGVFVGNWGEMNGSRYLKEKSYLKLLQKLHTVVPKSAFLAVRTPGYWRMAAGRMLPLRKEEAWKPEMLISRLSLYNDAIMGNESDYGTYGETDKKEAKQPSEHWKREDEIAFQNELNLYVPNGGEVITNNQMNDMESAVPTLKEMHVSYLNSDYDTEVLQKWKYSIYRGEDSLYDGFSGYDYIERHLGYRFVIRSANVNVSGFWKKKIQMYLEIENVGFSSRYTPCRVEISLYDHENGQKVYEDVLDTDVRNWKPSETVTIKSSLPVLENGELDLYLRITDRKRGETVWLANQEIGDIKGKYLLGRLHILQD